MRLPLITIVLLTAGCDIFLIDNPGNCEKNAGLCQSTQRCDRITKRCVSAPTEILLRPSRSSTIALSDDNALVAMVNPEDGTLAVFQASDPSRKAVVRTGAEPAAVVLHPDKRTAFVANRADASVVRVSGLDTGSPVVSAPIQVGSEPTGLALSPGGTKLYVAEFAESRVSMIDTASMKMEASAFVRSPRTLLVTNDLDREEDDELVVVPEFFGEPDEETGGLGRHGNVRILRAGDLGDEGGISLEPLSSEEAGFGAAASPNQLFGIAMNGPRLYVTSISVSPEAPLRFDSNVNPVIHVVDLAARAEVRGPTGSASLARKVAEAIPSGTRFFLADIVDLEFVPKNSGVGYVVARGADVIQRVVYDLEQRTLTIGSQLNQQIDVSGDDTIGSCLQPTGMAVVDPMRAYVNCWGTQSLGILDLNKQKLIGVVPATATQPGALELKVQNGRRLFFTGRGRWSNEAWSSCGSCHPDGLSDNVTWVFGSGPRQTPSLDGSYSHGAGTQKQRIFNWTAITDEIHDFESNVRNTSGGKGALTTAANRADCGKLERETQLTLPPAPLGVPLSKGLQDAQGCNTHWDDIELFIRSIRPPRGRRGLDAQAVRRGAEIFAGQGGCTKCHAGAGWTVSRRFYEPVGATVDALARTVTFQRPAEWPKTYTFHMSTQIAPQPAEADPDAGVALGPPQLACAIRNVGSFGIPSDKRRTDRLEVRADGSRAQGRGGYNVPSLYGLSLGAPFLHHGQARTLEQLFTDARFRSHAQAGAANFLTDGNAGQLRNDLVAFLLSIDKDTPELGVPAGFDAGCRTSN